MGVICSRQKDKTRENNSYAQMLKMYSGGYNTQEGKCELIGTRYCEKIDKQEMTLDQVINDIVEYTKWHYLEKEHVQFCWLSLHLALGLCYQYNIKNKATVRALLLELLPYSRGIDMGLFMRDLLHYEDLSPNNEMVKKAFYCLHFAAGFKIDLNNKTTEKLFKGPSKIVYRELVHADYCHYLDVPIGHPTLLMTQSTIMDTHIGQQSIVLACESLKPEVVLILLQHGVSPLGRTMEQLLATLGAVDVMAGAGITMMDAPKDIVMECLTYCLRVIRTITLRFTGQTFGDVEAGIANTVYYVKAGAERIIPSHHWKSPCPLKHLCRCEIRDLLLQSDNLPDGISKLPGLTEELKNYVNIMS
ncbi:hypothetical protein FSP39_024098 [Pinctada imbricata]|uniref:SOCS box domain-containing protein n=1 Tax=Pinctada imbricata TaxID=66713 RepID=A0AA88YEV5_PINIB|nr:hypothetical protein FSP39_024098 [Pinctada imbricata]